jgi:hypothetical protein
MIRKFNRRVIGFILALALFLGWSGVAHSQPLYTTVHQTTSRVLIASEECNGECHIEHESLGSRGFIRLLCGIDDGEPIPTGFILASFIACEESPMAMIGVWDRRNEEPVCEGFDMGVISGAHQETGEGRGKAEFLYSADGPPLFVTVLARYGPLPRRFEMDTSCWSGYRTHSVAGALDEDVVIKKGELRAGSAIAVYDDVGDR